VAPLDLFYRSGVLARAKVPVGTRKCLQNSNLSASCSIRTSRRGNFLSYAPEVKTTRYFELRMKDRPEIRREWCDAILRMHDREVQQDDGKYQMWGYIAEAGKYLRVITLEDRETVDNAFFDRSYARKQTTS